jgi:hypothetical protein
MLASVQGRGNTDARGKIAGPHAATDDDIVSVDTAFIGVNASDPLSIVPDFGDFGVLENPCAASACALGAWVMSTALA